MSKEKKMTKEKITITSDISVKNPIRRVHVKVGAVLDYREEYGDDDKLSAVLHSIGIGIENKLAEIKKV